GASRSGAIQGRGTRDPREPAKPVDLPAGRRRPDRGADRSQGRGYPDGAALLRRVSGTDHRHLPWRTYPHRPAELLRRSCRRSALDRAGTTTARAATASRTPQDRYPTAYRRSFGGFLANDRAAWG